MSDREERCPGCDSTPRSECCIPDFRCNDGAVTDKDFRCDTGTTRDKDSRCDGGAPGN